jgi:hypothetical protein
VGGVRCGAREPGVVCVCAGEEECVEALGGAGGAGQEARGGAALLLARQARLARARARALPRAHLDEHHVNDLGVLAVDERLRVQLELKHKLGQRLVHPVLHHCHHLAVGRQGALDDAAAVVRLAQAKAQRVVVGVREANHLGHCGARRRGQGACSRGGWGEGV